MINELKEKYTAILDNIIQKVITNRPDAIFVFSGISPYIHMENFMEHITDPLTFNQEGNSQLYTLEWFGKTLFPKLCIVQGYQILSHQQFAYLVEYLNSDHLISRVIIIQDNLRTLYPLATDDYREGYGEHMLEERPDDLPIYQAEQLKINDEYFYSLKAPSNRYEVIPLFDKQKELSLSHTMEAFEILDVISNPYAIDAFVNKCISSGNFNRKAIVKVSGKHIQSTHVQKTLYALNHLLSGFGGEIQTLHEAPIKLNYIPSDKSLSLLKQYWGESATFRDILVYENPETGNRIVPISQGLIVDTIIQEYQKGYNGEIPRDIFITAPTGAGKSLIFQLPAFYAAENGDVTIVVSPLKALMTDQVNILHNQRHYTKVQFLNSDLTLLDREKIIESCKNGETDILYLSPELLLSYDISYFIGERKLGLLIIDEAHLITTWGRDFRVDYWFLGNHINKIRKYHNYAFPMVALTATAVYGGINDMVFDSINSLNMNDPHKFIGNVRRTNIEFVISNHEKYKGKYDENKENETLDFIQGIHEMKLKGIIYAPYTTQINKLKDKADNIDPQMIVAYHGSMAKDHQQRAYQSFKDNTCKVMIATKAFGMGVDIPDIQIVYHHAPSGLLPDYIQEIGRAARKDHIQGYAALTFSKSDLRYSKQLFGLSSLRTFQLQEIMKKIIRLFTNSGGKRNMLVSASDFGFIFDTHDGIDQKVSTALMMIEKDYLIKTRFNVFIARPKKVFTKVYARTDEVGIQNLKKLFGPCFKPINIVDAANQYIELNLDDIWSKHFTNLSFPKVKNEFYKMRFLSEHGINLIPQIKISIHIDCQFSTVYKELETVLTAVCETLTEFKNLKGCYIIEEYTEYLKNRLKHYKTNYRADKIIAFIFGTYSGKYKHGSLVPNSLEGDAFLQQRIIGNETKYRIMNSHYESQVHKLLRLATTLFGNGHSRDVTRYKTINDIPLKNHIRLGSLLEIMNLGTFTTTGGEEPKLFVRLNDPRRIEKDSKDSNYQNYILNSVKNRHKSSCELFEYFFTHHFDNETRWNMIEDFFLGMSNEELMEKYPSSLPIESDILGYLKKNTSALESEPIVQIGSAGQSNLFKPKENQTYYPENLLTIEQQTMTIIKWLSADPVRLHQTMVKHKLSLPSEETNILFNKLRLKHPKYYRDIMRLKIHIQFPGYKEPVVASVPYHNQPVKFYKWWKKNADQVSLNYLETIKLLLAVENEDPTALLKADRAKINK